MARPPTSVENDRVKQKNSSSRRRGAGREKNREKAAERLGRGAPSAGGGSEPSGRMGLAGRSVAVTRIDVSESPAAANAGDAYPKRCAIKPEIAGPIRKPEPKAMPIS